MCDGRVESAEQICVPLEILSFRLHSVKSDPSSAVCFLLNRDSFITVKWNDWVVIHRAALHTHAPATPFDVLTLFISGSLHDWNGGLGSLRPVNQHVSWHLVLCFPFQSNTRITCYEAAAGPPAPLLSLVVLTDGVCSARTIFQAALRVVWHSAPNAHFHFRSFEWLLVDWMVKWEYEHWHWD